MNYVEKGETVAQERTKVFVPPERNHQIKCNFLKFISEVTSQDSEELEFQLRFNNDKLQVTEQNNFVESMTQ